MINAFGCLLVAFGVFIGIEGFLLYAIAQVPNTEWMIVVAGIIVCFGVGTVMITDNTHDD